MGCRCTKPPYIRRELVPTLNENNIKLVKRTRRLVGGPGGPLSKPEYLSIFNTFNTTLLNEIATRDRIKPLTMTELLAMLDDHNNAFTRAIVDFIEEKKAGNKKSGHIRRNKKYKKHKKRKKHKKHKKHKKYAKLQKTTLEKIVEDDENDDEDDETECEDEEMSEEISRELSEEFAELFSEGLCNELVNEELSKELIEELNQELNETLKTCDCAELL